MEKNIDGIVSQGGLSVVLRIRYYYWWSSEFSLDSHVGAAPQGVHSVVQTMQKHNVSSANELRSALEAKLDRHEEQQTM
jgi:hypothetical protein